MNTDRGRDVFMVIVAGVVGSGISALISEVIVGAALSAQGPKLEMGGIPLLLSALLFAPILAAMLAGLLPTGSPYWAGFAAQIGLVAIAYGVQEYHGYMATTIISPAPLPFYALVGLWGSLLVDTELRGRAARFRRFRDGSVGYAVVIFFFALLGAAIYWVQPLIGLIIEVVVLVLFFGWLSRRNRQAQRRHSLA